MKFINNIISSFYERIINTKEFHKYDLIYSDPNDLSDKTYFLNVNIEKQILIFIQRICKKGNVLMQNFMRDQNDNIVQYNIPQLLYNGVFRIKQFMRYSLAADFFDESLETINDLIQGPNIENLKYAI